MIYRVLRALVRIESGRTCRSCDEAIDRGDAFGLSEAVCAPCRA